MPSETVSATKDSAIKANHPEGLVKLQLVRKTSPSFEYYVRYPLRHGPQPLLGVREYDKNIRFPDSRGFTPRKLGFELRRWPRLLKPIPLPYVSFSDALTILPKSFPYEKTPEGKPRIIVCPHLFTAMAILTIEYRDIEKQYRSNPEIMAAIPKSVADERFKPAGDKRLIADIKKVLPRTEREARTFAAGGLYGHMIRLLRWLPWNLVSGQALAQEWAERWRILERWRAWKILDMSFPERAYDLAGRNAKKTPPDPEAFRLLGEALRKRCRRMGLPA